MLLAHLSHNFIQADLLTSLTAPYSSDAQLECYILWLVLVWTIDDIRDKFFLEDYGDSINDHEVTFF